MRKKKSGILGKINPEPYSYFSLSTSPSSPLRILTEFLVQLRLSQKWSKQHLHR